MKAQRLGQISFLANKPVYGSDEYREWIGQEDFIRFLQSNSNSTHVIIYGAFAYEILFGVLVPKNSVSPPDIEDIDRWSYYPDSTWGISYNFRTDSEIWISPPLESTSSNTLEKGEPLLFIRDFDGRSENSSYFELSQKLIHVLELHYVRERNAYCRIDKSGDIEEVINIFTDRSKISTKQSRVVSILREAFDEYLALSNNALVILFDSTRYEPKIFTSWGNLEHEQHKQSSEIYYRQGRRGDEGSFIRGFQIIQSGMTKKDVYKIHSIGAEHAGKYVDFIAQDLKHQIIDEFSCDPNKLGNYFKESDWPLEISPAFFRPEVLAKYKADSDKYDLQSRSINCRNAWHLQTYGVNDAGQVFTYLKYLSYLPYEEQLYWKSFNEKPKAPIPESAIKTDFRGEWDLDYDALSSLGEILRELDESKVAWWVLADKGLIEKVHYPITEGADDWGREILSLHKLLIEGFITKNLKAKAIELNRELEQDWKSIKLLEEILIGMGQSKENILKIINPLRELNTYRNKLSAHTKDDKSKAIRAKLLEQHRTYPNHFKQFCEKCDDAMRDLNNLLG